jgi:hypothetical protein
MMDEVIYRCQTKATDREGDRLRFSLNWALARRAELRLTASALECGDWFIPFDRIDDAVLVAVPTRFGTSYSLRIEAIGTTYQFQLKSMSPLRFVLDPFWLGSTPLALRREVGRIEMRRLLMTTIVAMLALAAVTYFF